MTSSLQLDCKMLSMQSTKNQPLVGTVSLLKVTTKGTITHAILYHYEQVWYAAWLPPKGKEDDYIYGYTYAYKDTATAYKVIPHALRQQKDICVYKPSGRTQFCYLYTIGN
jgi:hypothetical protein